MLRLFIDCFSFGIPVLFSAMVNYPVGDLNLAKRFGPWVSAPFSSKFEA